ncbi:MurR/RpiR family transcriptional regulator [Rummeliibacillus pycnus]|uniref:MurR/RpiR family transcriptional regulator n=1 Tax=Rummeliibacillus pycnus TaxID=101070 RepID=UPI000C9A9690|nr:MurR/RpiR family transcriptional regulator [Rummeliibacillus pycnus]
MTQNTIKKINSLYPRLSEKEKKIADYIQEDPSHIINKTINEVSADLSIADATVFRFCKRLGFKGYQAMKIALASEAITPIKQIHEEISENDDERTIFEKIFKSNIQTLENTMHILDEGSIKKAVSFMNQAKHIYFYGTGGSAVIAMDAYHKFVRTGVKCFAFIDSHFQLMSASQLSSDDLAVVISHSGRNRDTLQITKTVKENGASIIAITGFPKSPISQLADVALYTSSEETEYRSEALSSRIGQLSIIDALYVNAMVKHKDDANYALEKMRHAISQTRI